jgi:hypothetical protein
MAQHTTIKIREKMKNKILPFYLAFLCLTPFLRAEEFRFDHNTSIFIDLPSGWTSKSKVGKEGSLEISLKSKSDKKMKCDVSVIHAPPPADARLLDPEKLRTTVDLLAKFKGVKSSPKPIQTEDGIGYIAYDSNGYGMCMITPRKGISVTVHFMKSKDLEALESVLATISTKQFP